MKSEFTFGKDERLRKRKEIGKLFSEGNSFIIYPYKIVWHIYNHSTDSPTQVLISIPKRKFKLAVKRNLLKRRTREAYRIHKHVLYNFLENKNTKLIFAFIYIGNKETDYKEIEYKTEKIIQRLQTEINKKL